jgi:hypothetical protein
MDEDNCIQIIADEEILKWWEQLKFDRNRQEKLREAVKIGIRELEGKSGICDLNNQHRLEAIMNQGAINLEAPIEQNSNKPLEKLMKLRKQIISMRR